MKKQKEKVKITKIHLLSGFSIFALGIFLGAFLYSQLIVPSQPVKPTISVKGMAEEVTEGASQVGSPPGSTLGGPPPVASECAPGYERCNIKITNPKNIKLLAQFIIDTIEGQEAFNIEIAPSNTYISYLEIYLLDENKNITGKMYCSTVQGAPYFKYSCDTLAFSNSLSYVNVHAYGQINNILHRFKLTYSESDANFSPNLNNYLLGLFPDGNNIGDGVSPYAGPFKVENSFSIISPSNNATVFGSTPLMATLSGDASAVSFSVDLKVVANAIRSSSSSKSSTWTADWDTTGVANDSHDISLSFTTLHSSNEDRLNVATKTVKVSNCIPNQNQTCDEWSTCSSNGKQTRTCNDGCGVTDTQTRVCQCTPIEKCPEDAIQWDSCIGDKQTGSCDNGCGGTLKEEISCYSKSDCTPKNTCPDEVSWSICSADGEQTRSCDNGCGVKITQTRVCTNLSVPTITYPTQNLETDNPQPEIKGTAFGGSSVRVFWVTATGKILQSPDLILVPSTGLFTYQIPSPLLEGTYKVYVQAFYNNETKSSAEVSFKISSPTVVMLIPQQGQELTASVTLTAEVTRGKVSSLEFYRDKVGGLANVLIGQASPQKTNANVWQYFWDTADTENGQYDIYAKIKDAAGVKIYSSNKVGITVNHDITTLVPKTTEVTKPLPTDDTDSDGVPDLVEKDLGSDPNNPDSDGDGVSDGKAVEQGKDPTGKGAVTTEQIQKAQKQISEVKSNEPKYIGQPNPEVLKIKNISNAVIEFGKEGVMIEGQGPPNTIVTIYIYSQPIVVTTKTDENGNFKYILEKDLTEGEHEIYVTINDETGKVIEKSEPFAFFVKKARAVSREEYFRGDVNVEEKSPSILKVYVILCLVIILAVLIGFIVYRIIKGPEKPSQKIILKEDTNIK